MRTKLIYSAPVSVCDSLGELVTDSKVIEALADISCLEGTVLEYADAEIPDLMKFRGGYLRLALDGKRLRVQIEIDSPRKLTKSELAELHEDLDGQVSDGIGEGAFDFVKDEANLSVVTFPDLGGKKSTLVQTSGDAWRPGKISAETNANRRRCEAAAKAAKATEQKGNEKRATRKGVKLDPKNLFRLMQKGNRKNIAAEIARLGGDLGFIQSKQIPCSYDLWKDSAVLKLLLDAGLDPNLYDPVGQTLLWLAAKWEPCMRLLLDRGADPNLRNTDVFEETPLMSAACFDDVKCVRLLLDRGADPSLKSHFGDTAIDIARKRNSSRLRGVIQVLSKANKRK